MDNRKLLKKQIREFIKQFAYNNNFMLYQRTFAVREVENLLHIVCFDFPPASMQCHVAIQPLYVPEANLHFTFGNRLNYLGVRKSGLWGREESKIHEDIEEISNLLESNALPWFNEVSSPEKLIGYIIGDSISGSIIQCPPFLRTLYLGFSYLYIKKYDLANEALNKALNMTSDYIGKYKDKNVSLIVPLLNKIENNEFNSIDNDLRNFIEFTKENCKLI